MFILLGNNLLLLFMFSFDYWRSSVYGGPDQPTMPSWANHLYRVVTGLTVILGTLANVIWFRVMIEPYVRDDEISQRLREMKYIWNERGQAEKYIRLREEIFRKPPSRSPSRRTSD